MGHKHSVSMRRASSSRRSGDWRSSVCDGVSLHRDVVSEMVEKSHGGRAEEIEEILRR